MKVTQVQRVSLHKLNNKSGVCTSRNLAHSNLSENDYPLKDESNS